MLGGVIIRPGHQANVPKKTRRIVQRYLIGYAVLGDVTEPEYAFRGDTVTGRSDGNDTGSFRTGKIVRRPPRRWLLVASGAKTNEANWARV